MESPIPPYLVNDFTDGCAGWITIDEAIRPPNPNPRLGVSSSLGALGPVPPEVVHMFLDMLDAQSVARFARVCTKSNAFVQAHLSYTRLVKNAPKALLALKKVGLIGLHSIAKLSTTLRSEQCTSCTHFGPFLFLPTCTRCCYNCLYDNPLLSMLSLDHAKRYFGLTEQSIQKLPILRTIPGRYGPHPRGFHRQRVDSDTFVTLEDAKDLGIKIHGSIENMASVVGRKSNTMLWKWTFEPRANYEDEDDWLLEATTFYKNIRGNGQVIDEYFGIAFVPFPSVSKSGTVEHGFRCRGCLVNLKIWGYYTPNSKPSSKTSVTEMYRYHSTASFLSHISLCDGVQRLRRVHDDVRNRGLVKKEFEKKAVKIKEY